LRTTVGRTATTGLRVCVEAISRSRRQRLTVITERIVPSVVPREGPAGHAERSFRSLLERGAKLLPAGEARRHPRRLLSGGYTPKHAFDLFETGFYVTNVRQNEDIRFFVAYVVQGAPGRERIHPRLFYKDLSLVWRSASHFVRSENDNWVGKGELKVVVTDGVEMEVSDEATTDLPLEIQSALETLSRRSKRIPYDQKALELVLRRGSDDRMDPYRDFTEPRRRARSDPRNLVNRGRSFARFTRRNDPTSLRFVRGFEPDFRHGLLETAHASSRMYGGALRRCRILSKNRKVQYLFLAGPRQVWIGACQTTHTELSSFGLRTLDAVVDDDLLIPGFEYHFIDEHEDPPVLVSQIPEGFAGAPSEVDPSRADTSAWLDQVPVIQEFRRLVPC
jgi:hypothetical protein